MKDLLHTSAAEIAVELIERPLRRMLDNIEPAVQRPGEDQEYVHQLRVGSRRAGVAIKIFAPVLNKKDGKKLAQSVRSWRRAAGNARDLDVFAGRLRKWQTRIAEAEQPAFDFCLGFTAGLRDQAQHSLIETADELDSEDLWTQWTALRNHLRTGTATFGDLLAPAVDHRLQELESALQNETQDPEELHETRIRAKNLRYALELTKDRLPEEVVTPLIRAPEQIQEVLGEVHDCDVATIWLRARVDSLRSDTVLWARMEPGMKKLENLFVKLRAKRLRQLEDCHDQWTANDMGRKIRELFA